MLLEPVPVVPLPVVPLPVVPLPVIPLPAVPGVIVPLPVVPGDGPLPVVPVPIELPLGLAPPLVEPVWAFAVAKATADAAIAIRIRVYIRLLLQRVMPLGATRCGCRQGRFLEWEKGPLSHAQDSRPTPRRTKRRRSARRAGTTMSLLSCCGHVRFCRGGRPRTLHRPASRSAATHGAPARPWSSCARGPNAKHDAQVVSGGVLPAFRHRSAVAFFRLQPPDCPHVGRGKPRRDQMPRAKPDAIALIKQD